MAAAARDEADALRARLDALEAARNTGESPSGTAA
jgi:BMFP domain-containing protein YqiC